MKILVRARPGAKEQGIKKVGENSYIVSIKEPPIQGMANKAIIAALAKYFNKPALQVRIVVGHSSKQKTIEIQD